ncbi:endonuclease/exonuclease/phosphatase family protein [Demetria terragena]|uniref:endonuclease/exonuclease/phosphatase family protein n=1 Tax=Demetria terragena TaxID=63959 RepID=UPI00038024C5|nr:endonuclease/exonuclease/phosphatase family protein [Demetria terragena]
MPRPVRLSRRSILTGLAIAVSAPPLTAVATSGANHPQQPPALIGAQPAPRIHVMSFNIRLDTYAPAHDPDSWPRRRPALTALITQEQPDLLGVQEATFLQLPTIRAALPHHEMVGYGRSGGSTDEHNAIFFDTRRFELIGWEQFWLSDTPDVVGSANWGNVVTRTVVWARLRDRTSHREFVYVNTHFDHESRKSRARSARVVADLRGQFGSMPMVVTGDFNAATTDKAVYAPLTKPYVDTWVSARRHVTPAYGTFAGYDTPRVGAERIDWILTTPGTRVHSAAVNSTKPQGVWPSDHMPVQAVVELA